MSSLPILLLLAAASSSEPKPRIEPSSADGREVRVLADVDADRLAGFPEGEVPRTVGRELLQFSLVDQAGRAGRSMLGSYSRAGDALTFVPRFPLSHGSRYRATLFLSSGKRIAVDHLVRDSKKEPLASVAQVYPTIDVLPANALKFYIHFSKSMRHGRAIFDRIHLLDAKGQQIPDPWRRTELWSVDDRRFTLWIHPGRVKRGVNLREDFGPVLEPGGKYTLLISQKVQDASGQPLKSEFRKHFSTSAENHQRLDIRDWKLSSPQLATKEVLTIDLGKPLDHALLLRCLEVRAAAGDSMAGRWSTTNNDTRARFHPEETWPVEPLALIVDGILEDLAGNTPLRAFDTDLQGSKERPVSLQLPIRIRAGQPGR